jgi:hypothetical protein
MVSQMPGFHNPGIIPAESGWYFSERSRNNLKRRLSKMARKTRSDKTVGKVEKDLGLSTGAIRNKDGRDTRSDKKLGTLRKEQSK